MNPSKSILVVEDDDVVRMLTVEVLEEFDYQVVAAADADEALQCLKSGQAFDLLMTDVGLPGMSGHQLAELARQLQPRLPILFASGYIQGNSMGGTSELTASPGLQQPFDMIGKPFTLDQLRAKVDEMLAKQ